MTNVIIPKMIKPPHVKYIINLLLTTVQHEIKIVPIIPRMLNERTVPYTNWNAIKI